MKTNSFYIMILVFLLGILLIQTPRSNAQSEDPESKTHSLSLDDATQLAIQNNFRIQLARFDLLAGREDTEIVKSLYDVIFNADISYRDNRTERSSSVFGTDSQDNIYNFGLVKRFPTGTDIRVSTDNLRAANNAPFSSTPVTNESLLSATVFQDLGRNFFGMADRRQIRISELNVESLEYLTWEQIENEIADVQMAYWNLVFAEEMVEIERNMVERARKFFEFHQERLDNGFIELPEAIASEANYESRRNDLRLAMNNRQFRGNTLKLLLNIEEDGIKISPTDAFLLTAEEEVFEESLQKAFRKRKEYLAQKVIIDSRQLNLEIKDQALWPEINLEASFRRNGLGSRFQDSLEKVLEENNPDFFIGLSLEWPIQNRRAEAEWTQAQYEDAKALLELKFLERVIVTEIQDQVRSCNLFREVARNAVAVAELQLRKLEEEQKRFTRGRSSTDRLIRFQEDMLQSRKIAAEAKNRYHHAIIELRFREGVLLSRYDDPGTVLENRPVDEFQKDATTP